MKKLLLIVILFSQSISFCQTSKRSGFIENISESKYLTMVFVTDMKVESVIVEVDKKTVIEKSGKPFSLDKLRCGMELTVEADFKVQSLPTVSLSISVKEVDSDRKLKNCRLDKLNGDIAYLGGNKVRLAPGAKFKGKGLYNDKNIKGWGDIIPTNLLDVKGDFANGFFNASEIKVEPADTDFDKAADTIGQKIHNQFYPDWTDRNLRSRFFGTYIPGYGNVVPDIEAQNYLEDIAAKLIPPYYQKKIKFMFILVDNERPQANVRPNGVAIINIGMLKKFANEAQLAAVLAHEIAHVLYKHSADQLARLDKLHQREIATQKGDKEFKDFAKKNEKKIATSKNAKTNSNSMAAVSYGIDTALKANMALIQKLKSGFSVEQESEADQVGICLMAMAGYDPRETAVFWKNFLNSYEVSGTKQNRLAAIIHKGWEIYQKESKTKSTDFDFNKNSKVNISGNAASQLLNLEFDFNMAKNEGITHPTYVSRLKDVYRIIELYWSDPVYLVTLEIDYDAEEKYSAFLSKIYRSIDGYVKPSAKPSPAKTKKVVTKKAKK